jgi:hypothetical protein
MCGERVTHRGGDQRVTVEDVEVVIPYRVRESGDGDPRPLTLAAMAAYYRNAHLTEFERFACAAYRVSEITRDESCGCM